MSLICVWLFTHSLSVSPLVPVTIPFSCVLLAVNRCFVYEHSVDHRQERPIYDGMEGRWYTGHTRMPDSCRSPQVCSVQFPPGTSVAVAVCVGALQFLTKSCRSRRVMNSQHCVHACATPPPPPPTTSYKSVHVSWSCHLCV